MAATPPAVSNREVYKKIALFMALTSVGVVFGILLIWKGYLIPFLEWVADIGIWGNVFIIIAFIPASLPIAFGYTPLALASGYIYGVFWGSVTSEIGAVLGGCIAFWATRRLFRDTMKRYLEGRANVRGFMQSIEGHGFKVVALMRCAPLPYGLQNGLFAVSTIDFQTYTWATIVGLIPEQLLFSYVGTTLRDIAEVVSGRAEFSPLQMQIFTAQIVVSTGIFIFVAYLGKKATEISTPPEVGIPLTTRGGSQSSLGYDHKKDTQPERAAS